MVNNYVANGPVLRMEGHPYRIHDRNRLTVMLPGPNCVLNMAKLIKGNTTPNSNYS